MKSNSRAADAEVKGELAALRRASRSAFKLAKETGTPFIIVRDGKIANLNPDAQATSQKCFSAPAIAPVTAANRAELAATSSERKFHGRS